MFVKLGNRLLGMILDHIGNDDVARIFAVDGDVDAGSDAVAFMPFGVNIVHHFTVADGDDFPVDKSLDSAARDFFDVIDFAAIGFVAVGLS